MKVLKYRNENIATDRTQRVDKKNELIFLFIMFTPRVMVIKMSKMAADHSKKSVRVWEKYLTASGRSYLALSGNAMIYKVLSYHWQGVDPCKHRVLVFVFF